MNVNRLKWVRQAIMEAHEDQFDMTVWGAKKPCGTVHCAIGWATTMKEVRDSGLHLPQPGEPTHPLFDTPRYKNLEGFEAIAAWLNTEIEMAEYLFDSINYVDGNRIPLEQQITRQDVIERINQVEPNRKRPNMYKVYINGVHLDTVYRRDQAWRIINRYPLGTLYEVHDDLNQVVEEFIPYTDSTPYTSGRVKL